MKRTIILASALVLVALNVSAKPVVTAVKGGTLVNSNGSPPIANSVILIEDNRIRQVGTAGHVNIPKGARVVDAQGKWIIPGLIDAHVHFFQSGGLYTRPDVIDLRKRVPYADGEMAQIHANLQKTFARYLRCGITSVADVGGPFWNFDVRDAANKAAIAPRVSVAGPLLSTVSRDQLDNGDPPIIKVNNADEAIALVRREAERKPDFIKIWYIVGKDNAAQQHFDLVKAAIAEIHRHKIRAAVHATELETARLAVEAGADILVHSVFDADVDDRFVALLKERNVIYTPTLIVNEGYREVLRQRIQLTPAEHRLADPFAVATLFDLQHIPASDLPEWLVQNITNAKPVEPDVVAMRNLKKLHDAGVVVAAGSDAGNIGTLPGPALFREFELMSDAGLTPAQILISATRGGAQLLGRSDRLGTIEPGKLADMVLLNSDPLADIRNTADIHAVIKDGVVHDAATIIRNAPADVVQRQVNAYNAHDLDAFVGTYHVGVVLYAFPDKVIGSGTEHIRASYGRLFQNAPKLHVEIRKRITVGSHVIDEERVTGTPNGQVLEALAIYEVNDGLIEKVWFIMK